MAWYRTGTVTVTNGSKNVTGAGTAFVANASVGEGFLGPDGRIYEIESVVSNTALTLVSNYQGSGASGQSYAILPTQSTLQDLAAEAAELIASFAVVRDNAGQGLFGGGSAAAPGIRFSSDQDTGIFSAAANQLGISAGGSEKIRVSTVGLAIGGGNASKVFHVRDTTSADILLEDSGAATLGDSSGQIVFARQTGFPFGGLYNVSGLTELRLATRFSTGELVFASGDNVERVRVTSGGDVGIGTSAPEATLDVRGNLDVGTSSVGVMRFKRPSQNYILANKSGTGSLYIGSGQGIFFCTGQNDGDFSQNETFRVLASGIVAPGNDNTQALGATSSRWSVVYAGSGSINTSDEREKVRIGDPSESEMRAAQRIIGELGSYQWLHAIADKGEDGARIHFGVRAQKAAAIFTDEGLDPGRYAWFCYDEWDEETEPVMGTRTVEKTRTVTRQETDPETGETVEIEAEETYEEEETYDTGDTRVTLEAGDRYGIRPDQLAFWLIAAQAKRQDDLEARIAAIEPD